MFTRWALIISITCAFAVYASLHVIILVWCPYFWTELDSFLLLLFFISPELCKSLKSVGEIAMRDGGGIRNRKPPKKERKKSLMANTNQVTTIVEQERLESLNVNNVTKLEARFGKQPVMSSSPYSHTTGKSLRMNVASEITDPSLYGIPPPTKRPKPLSNRLPSLGDDPDKPSGLTKFTSCRVKDFQLQSACSTGTKIPIANAVISKRDGHNNDFGLVNTDYPVPLATKIYYPQRRTNRLRSAVAHMYHASLNEEIPCDMSPDVPHRTNQLTASTQMGQHVDEITDYEGDHSAFTPGQISEAEGCLQDTSMSTQFPVSNLLVPQTPPIGLLGSKYLSSPYSLGGNSGQSIGTLQQKNGSVHAL
ncbi:hypothetical protein LINPERHAP2_LOCUS17283 [Linum perenne]